MLNSRLAVAIHILAVLEFNKDEHVTSEFLAQSIGTNPVVVRRLAKMLEKAGLIQIYAGVGGSELAKPLEQIHLIDVYHAVGMVDDEGLFAIHDRPHPSCPVGANIQATLEGVFDEARRALEQVLQQWTLQDIVADLGQRHTLSLQKNSV